MGDIDYDPPIPCCVTHGCMEVAEIIPDLSGRMARCTYFGSGHFRNHGQIYGGGECSGASCRCVVPSRLDLPFFVYQSGKTEDRFFCGCAGWD